MSKQKDRADHNSTHESTHEVSQALASIPSRFMWIRAAASAAVLLLLACSDGEQDTSLPRLGAIDAGKPEIRARVMLRPTQGHDARGVIELLWEGAGTRLDANFENLAPGSHAFHVHEFGDCSAPDASSAGGHFALVDAVDPKSRIMGNLGEIQADQDGRASFEAVAVDAQLAGPRSIVGRSVVVHAHGNDPKELPGGGAGARIACGVVEKVH